MNPGGEQPLPAYNRAAARQPIVKEGKTQKPSTVAVPATVTNAAASHRERIAKSIRRQRRQNAPCRRNNTQHVDARMEL